MASKYQLRVTRELKRHEKLIGFSLDQPVNKQRVDENELSSGRLRLFGWVLSHDYEPGGMRLFIKDGDQDYLLPLNTERPDVIEKVLGERSENHKSLICGFDHFISFSSSRLQVGVELEGKRITLFRVDVRGTLKVLEGKDDWLFLDNDANRSVAQHTGKLSLNIFSRWSWKRYISQFSKLKPESALVVAPSKELVYPQYYPYEKSGHTPMEQVCQMMPSNFPLVFPVDDLTRFEHRTFRKNDTHWTFYGAMVASCALMRQFGLSELASVFDSDEYRKQPTVGDLGNKLYPPVMSDEVKLKSAGYYKSVIYDNQLPNFGRVIIVANEKAAVNSTLLMFASSSGYSMLNYLYRIFRKIVFIHTAGSVDTQLIEQLAPQFIVSQTNARFVVRAPRIGISVARLIKKKLKAESVEGRKRLLESSQLMAEKSEDETSLLFNQLMCEVGKGNALK